MTWVFVALAAAFATFPWVRAAARLGKARALALAFAIQVVGIATPVLARNPVAVIFSAVALGATFMAITLFAAGLARDAAGQILGPIAATQLALRTHSDDTALLLAAAVAGVATIVTLLTIRDAPIADRRRAVNDKLLRSPRMGEAGERR